MKSFLFLSLFMIIICSPFGLERRQKLLERIEKIKKCVSEIGTESLKSILNNEIDLTIENILRGNKVSLTHEDLEILKECRRKSIFA